MNVPRESPGVALELAPLTRYKRKRCENCDKKFPLTKPNRRFCTTACKNEYGRHGSAFGPLKIKLEKLVRKLVATEVKTGWTTQLATLRAAGFLMADDLPAAFAAKNVALETLTHQLKALYARVRVLEAAVANGADAAAANARGAHFYTDEEIGRRKKPRRAGSSPSPRRRKANTRA